MTFEQTVEIPASHRLRLDLEVPPEIPAGKAILTFTPAVVDIERRARTGDAIERCWGLAKRMGFTCTSDDLLAERRKDLELEEAKYRRMFKRDEDSE
ncbi:hypothetical protein AGMMS49546_36610 [Spirochaetia bacterium]|nr:hypothetical protein AGMMS49546_36610 [Spirochaetia bacterium]